MANMTDGPSSLRSTDYRLDDTQIDIGSLCEIYSRSSCKWYSGTVIDILIDSETKHRWFTISYKNDTKIKKIQRFSKNLRFINEQQQTPPNLKSQSTETSINLTIFKQHKTKCSSDDITECDYVLRLLEAITYYISLNISQNTFNCDIFSTFCHDIYSEFINDWIHIISVHSHQMYAIRSALRSHYNITEYTTKESPIISRHYNTEYNVHKEENVAFEFYRQTMDDIYVYIFYLEDLGLRIPNTNIDDLKDEYDCIDYVFGTKKQSILNKRKQLDINMNPCNGSDNRFNIPVTHKHSDKTLDTGLVFHYWPYYKDEESYVEHKYDTYKEEILVHMNVNTYQQIVFKAQQFALTDRVREYRSRKDDALHFGIELSSPICISHLISLILYCDFNTFCNAFRGSFVPLNTNDSLSLVKQRHSEYWFTSKNLRESVSYYGVEGRGRWDEERCKYTDKICGPFYCGVNTVVYVAEFGVALCLPQSTSKCIDIAINYTSIDGMMISLNNDGAHMDEVALFECFWISRYAEYDEYLLFGDVRKIRIESIVIMDINKNFCMYISAMYVFDCMMSGRDTLDRMDITGNDLCIINQLISQNNDADKYINNTFGVYCMNKVEIVINIDYLNEYYGAMYYLIMRDIQKEYREDHEYDEYSVSNLLDPSIFIVFKNVKQITIHSTNCLGTYCYAFSLTNFLNVITSSSSSYCNWTQINIAAVCTNNYYDLPQPTWISKLWSSSAQQICAQYNERNLNIFKQNHMNINREGRKEEILVINHK